MMDHAYLVVTFFFIFINLGLWLYGVVLKKTLSESDFSPHNRGLLKIYIVYNIHDFDNYKVIKLVFTLALYRLSRYSRNHSH